MLERIEADIKTALQQQDAVTASVLRTLKSELHNAEIERGGELDETAVAAVLQKQAKQRRESIEEYARAGRDDKAEAEQQELAIIERYLPEPLDAAALEQFVRETIAEVGAESPADMGKVMKALQPKIAGRAEGSVVAQAVKDQLS